jgi:hypothetical protein
MARLSRLLHRHTCREIILATTARTAVTR